MIEKAAIAKEIKLAKLEKLMGGGGQSDSDDGGAQDDDSISFEHDAGEIDEIDALPSVSKYFECIFGLKELYVYRGVFYAYRGQYAQAVKDLTKLLDKQLFDDQMSQ